MSEHNYENMTGPEHFHREKFIIIQNLLDPYLVQFLSSYYSHMGQMEDGSFGRDWTSLNGYGDACADTVMYMLRDKIQEQTGEQLEPTFSFVRHYKKGDILNRHNDRPSNEINCTITITADLEWPIGFCHKFGGTEYILSTQPGDAVVYYGNELDHWRDRYKGESQVQLIVGFIRKDGEFDTPQFRFDGKGVPSYAPRYVKRDTPLNIMKRKAFVWWRNFKHRRDEADKAKGA